MKDGCQIFLLAPALEGAKGLFALHELVGDSQHLTGNVQLPTKLDRVIVFPPKTNVRVSLMQ